MKRYDIYFAGGEKIATIFGSSIGKACESFIKTLKKEARYKIDSRDYASIRYRDNYSICDDFVVLEA